MCSFRWVMGRLRGGRGGGGERAPSLSTPAQYCTCTLFRGQIPCWGLNSPPPPPPPPTSTTGHSPEYTTSPEHIPIPRNFLSRIQDQLNTAKRKERNPKKIYYKLARALERKNLVQIALKKQHGFTFWHCTVRTVFQIIIK
jgi:hypothetical protein